MNRAERRRRLHEARTPRLGGSLNAGPAPCRCGCGPLGRPTGRGRTALPGLPRPGPAACRGSTRSRGPAASGAIAPPKRPKRFNRFAARQPTHVGAWLNLSLANRSRSRIRPLPCRPARRAVDLRPGLAAAQATLAGALSATGDLGGAAKAYEGCPCSRPHHGSRASPLRGLAAPDGRRAWRSWCARQLPSGPSQRRERAGSSELPCSTPWVTPQPPMATEPPPLALAPAEPAGLRAVAAQLASRGRIAEALAAFDRAIAQAPENAALHRERAHFNRGRGAPGRCARRLQGCSVPRRVGCGDLLRHRRPPHSRRQSRRARQQRSSRPSRLSLTSWRPTPISQSCASRLATSPALGLCWVMRPRWRLTGCRSPSISAGRASVVATGQVWTRMSGAACPGAWRLASRFRPSPSCPWACRRPSSSCGRAPGRSGRRRAASPGWRLTTDRQSPVPPAGFASATCRRTSRVTPRRR